MRLGRMLGLLALPLLAATSAGCHTFKYFDIHVMFDPASFDSVTAFRVGKCQVTVSGADQDSFPLPDGKCPNRSNQGDALDAGTFEFSTFADSGTMVFKVETFEGLGEKPECKLGEGTAMVPVSSAMSIMSDLKIEKTGMGCPSM